jgi:hypothetical protein
MIDHLSEEEHALLRWVSVALWIATSIAATYLSFRGRGQPRWAWSSLAIACLGLAIETAYPFRITVTILLRETVRSIGGEWAFRNRRIIQVIVIAFFLAPVLYFFVNWVLRANSMPRGARIGLLGAGICFTGYILEAISLHYLDEFYVIYWVFRYVGLGLAAWGVALGLKPGRRIPCT